MKEVRVEGLQAEQVKSLIGDHVRDHDMATAAQWLVDMGLDLVHLSVEHQEVTFRPPTPPDSFPVKMCMRIQDEEPAVDFWSEVFPGGATRLTQSYEVVAAVGNLALVDFDPFDPACVQVRKQLPFEHAGIGIQPTIRVDMRDGLMQLFEVKVDAA